MNIDRKLIFDAAKRRGALFQTLADVRDMDAAIDAAVGLIAAIAPHPAPQVGLSDADYHDATSRLACSYAQLRAVDEVESGGGWFTDVRADILALDGPGGFLDGPNLPKILFEAYRFDQLTDGRFRAAYPNLSSATWNKALYIGGQAEWSRLYRAMQLDHDAALKSASYGRYQIMGFNYALAGYATVGAFVDAMKASEEAQLHAFVTFIINSNLADELRQVSNFHADCTPFAHGYNGPRYAANNYQVRLAKAHKKWAEA